MKMATISRLRAAKLRGAAMALAIGGLLASGNASAQWAVIDFGHIKAQMAEFAQQAARWGEQGQQWLKEYNQWKQQYDALMSRVNNMQSMFGLPGAQPMQRVPDDYMVASRCGSTPEGTGVAAIMGRLSAFTTGDNPQVRRWRYCAQEQYMRNKQFNEMVLYLQETVPEMNRELQRAGNEFQGGQKTEGEMNAMSAKLSKVNGDIAQSNEEFDTRMKAYDTYISATRQDQGSLTRSTMRGGNGLIQQVTNAAVMRRALCGGGKCD